MQNISSIYEHLTSIEQVLLSILAINYAPMAQQDILTALRIAKVQPMNHKGILNMQDIRDAIDKLAGFELIERPKRGGAQCKPQLVDEVMVRNSRKTNFPELIHIVQRCVPLSSFVYVDFRFIIREIRIALYTNNVEEVLKYMRTDIDLYEEGVFPEKVVVDVCSRPGFQKELFDSLHSKIKSIVFKELLEDALQLYRPLSDELYASLAKYGTIDQSEYASIRNIYAIYLILRGNLKEAEKVVQNTTESSNIMVAQGCVAFLKGENDKSLEIYSYALKYLQKEVGKKKIFFSQVLGLFYLFALVKAGSPEDLNKAKEFTQWGINTTRNKLMIWLNQCIYAAIIAQSNLISEAKAILSKIPPYFHKDNTFELFHELAAYWIDEDFADSRAEINKALFEKAHKNGFLLPALVHGRLYLKSRKDPSIQQICDQLAEQTGIQDIVDIVYQKEVWEKALNALINLSKKRNTASSKSQDCRLVWTVSMGNYMYVTPKEQRLNKNGKWSTGKKVANKRLLEGLDYMTAHDMKVAQAFVEIRKASYGSFGFYYHENHAKALLALVGHPLVFLEKSPDIAIDLVKGEPELIIEQTKQGYSLQFSESFDSTGIKVIKESPTRYKVIEIKEEHVQIANFMGKKKITVPADAKEKLIKAVSGISSLVTVHSSIEGEDETIPKIPPSANIYVHLLPVGHGFKLETFVKPFTEAPPYLNPGTGGKHVFTEINGKRVQTNRDLSLERGNAEKIINACPSLRQSGDTQWTWLFDNNEDCLQVLSELYEIKDQVTIEWPEGEKLKIRSIATLQQFHMNVYRENDWFAASGELKIDDNLIIQMSNLLDLFDDNSTRFIQLKDGEFLALTEQFRKRLEEINAYTEKDKKGIKFHPLATLALEDTMEEIKQLKVDKAWKDHLARLKRVQERVPAVPSTLQTELRNYQVEGFQWLSRLSDWGVGACLSDDMGLGKTIQALTVILERAKEGPVLVIAPASVCMNWIAEARRFAPTLNVTFFGEEKDRTETIQKQGSFDLLVSSYGLLQQEEELLAGKKWSTIVLDEGQAIKNISTKRSKAAMSLKGDFKIITTGTPIENHLGELWNLFQFINPGLFSGLKRFNEKFAIPIERDNNHQAKLRLKKLIQPFILRRTKVQVLEELPPKTEITLSVEMTPEECAFYEALRQKAVERIESVDLGKGEGHLQVLAEIMKLRRACCHSRLIISDHSMESSKLRLFGEVVQELLENNHKALVFSQFVDHLQIIKEYVESRNITYQYLDGGTPIKERKRGVDAFQAGEGELFLISLKAGGLGLNLTAADYVIHMDPWWNPAVEDQASDRAHRIGQQRPVTIYRLVTKGTIEEKIVNLHQQKRELADSLLEGSDMSGKITAEQLLQLIREK
ncbi:MAG: DEAD/DEAH box helicase [Candidatus Kuenenia sp.]|nr:DEAD/DEAH box helicase [Candidatus Kuenenia hertensis]